MNDSQKHWAGMFGGLRVPFDFRMIIIGFLAIIVFLTGNYIINIFAEEPYLLSRSIDYIFSSLGKTAHNFFHTVYSMLPGSHVEVLADEVAPNMWACGAILVWGLIIVVWFGALICRLTALRIAKEEKASILNAVRFVWRRKFSLLLTPIAMVVLFALLYACNWILGCIGSQMTAAGTVLFILLFVLVIISSFFMVCLIILLLFGVHLIPACIATEGCDGIETFISIFNYMFVRPWSYILYNVMIVFSLIFLVFAGGLFLDLVYQSSQISATQDILSYHFDKVDNFVRVNYASLEGKSLPIYYLKSDALQKALQQYESLSPEEQAKRTKPSSYSTGMRDVWAYISGAMVDSWILDPVQNETVRCEHRMALRDLWKLSKFWTCIAGILGLIYCIIFYGLCGYLFAYVFVATTTVYFLLRKEIDDINFNEVWDEEKHQKFLKDLKTVQKKNLSDYESMFSKHPKKEAEDTVVKEAEKNLVPEQKVEENKVAESVEEKAEENKAIEQKAEETKENPTTEEKAEENKATESVEEKEQSNINSEEESKKERKRRKLLLMKNKLEAARAKANENNLENKEATQEENKEENKETTAQEEQQEQQQETTQEENKEENKETTAQEENTQDNIAQEENKEVAQEEQQEQQEQQQESVQEENKEENKEVAQDEQQEQQQESVQESVQEENKEVAQEEQQESVQEENKEESAQDNIAQEENKETVQEENKETVQEENKEESAQDNVAQEENKEEQQETAQDEQQETTQDENKETAQDNIAQDENKETAQDEQQEQQQETAQDENKEQQQETAQDENKEQQQETTQDNIAQDENKETAQDENKETAQDENKETVQDNIAQDENKETAQDEQQEQQQEVAQEEENTKKIAEAFAQSFAREDNSQEKSTRHVTSRMRHMPDFIPEDSEPETKSTSNNASESASTQDSGSSDWDNFTFESEPTPPRKEEMPPIEDEDSHSKIKLESGTMSIPLMTRPRYKYAARRKIEHQKDDFID